MTQTTINFGNVNIGKHIPTSSTASVNNSAFHILVIGNFSGNQSTGSLNKPIEIDRDNFEDIIQRIAPEISISLDKNELISLNFSELEDFEPDAIYESVELFSQLRVLRKKLGKNSTFTEAAKKMNAYIGADTGASTGEKPTVSSTNNLLDNILQESENRNIQQQSSENLANNIIQKIVAPYIIPAADPQQDELIQTLDNSISGLMNRILHYPDFQALEASWRSLYLLTKRLQTNSKLKIFMLDANQHTLTKNLTGNEISNTAFYKKIIEPYTSISGSTPWSVMLGDYTFGKSVDDIQLLEKLGHAATCSNACFFTDASSQLLNIKSFGISDDSDDWTDNLDETILNAWQSLREQDVSRNIAACSPRVLIRLPYGRKTKEIESFEFEEMQSSEHEKYLWANGAYFVVALLAENFSVAGWEFKPGQLNEFDNLPIHHYTDKYGDMESKPCAELYLTERSAEKLMERGLLPIWSILNCDKIRIGPFVSMHKNHEIVVGQWNVITTS